MGIWGGAKKDDDPEDVSIRNNGERSIPNQPREVEADERTNLLPPPATGREGFLSPDDPAVSQLHPSVTSPSLIKLQVSPYNLWSIRFLRYFTVLFAVITFLWWVILLVSIFVSPPGMHSRGSGFFDFSYTTLTLGLLLVGLLFFSTPSKAAQVTCLVIAVFLLTDMIMIVAVSKLRVEEGWVGIASIIWALLISVWTVITDRTVAWGKHEEEERLTGRQETRRSLKEWSSVFISTAILVIIAIVAVLMSCNLILRARDASLPAPGEKYYVDGDKYQIHVYCAGDPHITANNTLLPTVFFEAGDGPFEHGLNIIAENALKNGSISRYCYADRPGIAWSDNAPSPFSAATAATVLSEALARAGEDGPWVLVSAGVGSIYSRVFSSRQGTGVKGLLLIDPLHEDLLYRLGSPHRGFLLWAWGIISPLGLDRIPAAIFKGRSREDRVYGRAAYQGGKFIKAKLQESLVANSLTKNEVISSRNIQLQDTPLVVISSGIQVKKDTEWNNKQRDLSHLTNKLVSWDVVSKAPSEVWSTLEGREIIEKRLKQLVYA